jgi:hypothetical protein
MGNHRNTATTSETAHVAGPNCGGVRNPVGGGVRGPLRSVPITEAVREFRVRVPIHAHTMPNEARVGAAQAARMMLASVSAIDCSAATSPVMRGASAATDQQPQLPMRILTKTSPAPKNPMSRYMVRAVPSEL